MAAILLALTNNLFYFEKSDANETLFQLGSVTGSHLSYESKENKLFVSASSIAANYVSASKVGIGIWPDTDKKTIPQALTVEGNISCSLSAWFGDGAHGSWAGPFHVRRAVDDGFFRFSNPNVGGYGGVIWAGGGGKYILKMGNYLELPLFNFLSTGHANMYGTLTQNTSDMRLKDNRVLIPNALDKVNSIGGYSFDWNDKQPIYEAGTHDVGLLAQEVQEVLPEAVSPAPFDFYEQDPDTPEHLVGTSRSGEDYLTIHHEKVVPLLVNAIKELSAKVEALEAKLES